MRSFRCYRQAGAFERRNQSLSPTASPSRISRFPAVPIANLHRHPGPGDIALIVEVSDSTIARDRGIIKLRMYARAGLREYWIVDLLNRRIQVHTNPQGEAYRVLTVLSAADAIPVMIGGSQVGTIPVSSLLP